MMIRKAELKRALKAELLAHRDTSIRLAELEAANARLRDFWEKASDEAKTTYEANYLADLQSATERRVAELETALTEALTLADLMEDALDQEFGVTGDPPTRQREAIERLTLILKGRHAEEAQT